MAAIVCLAYSMTVTVALGHDEERLAELEAHAHERESFWSMIKRGYNGIYHKMTPKHLDRFVQEITGRHNLRDTDPIDKMWGVVSCMAGKRLRYSKLTADNGMSSGAGA